MVPTRPFVYNVNGSVSVFGRGAEPWPQLADISLSSENRGAVVTRTGQLLLLVRREHQFELRHQALPWAAAQVACRVHFHVVLSAEGGRVCTWGCAPAGRLGRGRDFETPEEVKALPRDDPVVSIAVGRDHVIVLTAGGDVYGWGDNRSGQLALRGAPRRPLPKPFKIDAFSGKGVLRMTCGPCSSYVETGAGQLLVAGGIMSLSAEPVNTTGIRFPLRALQVCNKNLSDDDPTTESCAVVDAAGGVWFTTSGGVRGGAAVFARARLPPGEPALSVAVADLSFPNSRICVLALSETGTLWDCSDPEHCFDVQARNPYLPRGLQPVCAHSGQRSPTTMLLVALPSGGFMRAFGREFSDADAALSLGDAGFSAQCEAELLRAPPDGVQPAAEGPLVLYVRAPQLGRPDPVCLEVSPDATAGGLALLAMLQMGIVQAASQAAEGR
eukprot:TRINITY_DN24179_c0_g1_i1.p1 TRINITY_DN24179_c0_g1~~TRINITY_DN24179_c0_g1_i1.p1  ORF type:complete len:467 (+),score=60.05 TRINITY_DN24179_c0_g1_i1:76-1401(+)